jgi:hypothetical protein
MIVGEMTVGLTDKHWERWKSIEEILCHPLGGGTTWGIQWNQQRDR